MKILREMGTKSSLRVILRGCTIVFSKSKDQEGILLNYLQHVRRRAAFAGNILINPTGKKKRKVLRVSHAASLKQLLWTSCFCHYK